MPGYAMPYNPCCVPQPCCSPGVCCPNICCGDPCCECGCGCGDNCCPPGNRLYASVEYLLWWVRGASTPPLVTSGSVNDPIPGAIGQPGTHVLAGGGSGSGSSRSGLRATVGYWLNEDHTLGVEVGGFFLENKNSSFGITSLGSPLIARPFIDAASGAQTVELVAAPGILGGAIAVSTTSAFNGAEANVRTNLWCNCNWYVDAFLGFRYLALTESLNVSENLTVLAPLTITVPSPSGPIARSVPSGTSFGVVDRFATQNRFYGTQIGTYVEGRWGEWSVGIRGSVGLGPIEQVVDVTGSTRISAPGIGTGSFPGGLLTQTSNIGRHTRDLFGVVPEVGVNFGYQLTDHIRAFIGYNFIYWNNVIRPGNAIDTRVNPNLIPPATGAGGPNLPAFAFRGSDFWAQGLTLGIEFRY
jgi:hypothetical protein